MVNDKQLVPGAFYWVIPKSDIERDDDWLPGEEWQDEIQPARFNGWNGAGEMLWNFMGLRRLERLAGAVGGGGDWGADRAGAGASRTKGPQIASCCRPFRQRVFQNLAVLVALHTYHEFNPSQTSR